MSPTADWVLLGMHRQRLQISLDGPPESDRAVDLRWQLLALNAGHLSLPAISLRRVLREEGTGALSYKPLPTPAYLTGSTVLVREGGVVQGAAGFGSVGSSGREQHEAD